MKTIAVSVLLAVAATGCGGGGGGGSGGGSGLGMLVAAPVAPAAPAETPKAPEPVSNCMVVLYGDSVMRGTNKNGSLSRSPAEELRRLRPAWSIEDKSLSGDTATLAEKRILNENRTAHVVVLSWGINDMTMEWDVVQPLKNIASYMKAEGRKVVITGLIHTENVMNDKYNADEMQVSIDSAAAFVSWGETPVKTVDGVHPDQDSSDQLVAELAVVLDKECR